MKEKQKQRKTVLENDGWLNVFITDKKVIDALKQKSIKMAEIENEKNKDGKNRYYKMKKYDFRKIIEQILRQHFELEEIENEKE